MRRSAGIGGGGLITTRRGFGGGGMAIAGAGAGQRGGGADAAGGVRKSTLGEGSPGAPRLRGTGVPRRPTATASTRPKVASVGSSSVRSGERVGVRVLPEAPVGPWQPPQLLGSNSGFSNSGLM